jgi:hypothetical protein
MFVIIYKAVGIQMRSRGEYDEVLSSLSTAVLPPPGQGRVTTKITTKMSNHCNELNVFPVISHIFPGSEA